MERDGKKQFASIIVVVVVVVTESDDVYKTLNMTEKSGYDQHFYVFLMDIMQNIFIISMFFSNSVHFCQ